MLYNIEAFKGKHNHGKRGFKEVNFNFWVMDKKNDGNVSGAYKRHISSLKCSLIKFAFVQSYKKWWR